MPRTPFGPPRGGGRRLRRRAAAAGLVLALGGAAGCGPGPLSDPLAARCADVLAYEQPGWRELEVLQARRHPHDRAVTLRFEAVAGPEAEPVREHIACGFRSGGRAVLERVVIGDRVLSAGELALANAELLLRDLGRGAAAPRPRRAGAPAA